MGLYLQEVCKDDDDLETITKTREKKQYISIHKKYSYSLCNSDKMVEL